jgi:integrase
VSHIYANLGFDIFRIVARPNEAHKVKWIEIDPNSNIIRINEHEKKSNPGLIKVSPELIAMLNMLPKKSENIFGTVKLRTLQRSKLLLM